MTTDTPLAALTELQAHPQWVLWRKEIRHSKPTKVPYNAYTGKRAASDDPSSWASYGRVLETLERYPTLYDGIGFMFNDDYIGIDLDHCVNDDGRVDPWAQEIIADLDSYAEYSPSRRGIHVLVHGVLPQLTDKHGVTRRPGIKRPVTGGPHHPAAVIEMYCQGRFFTVTGSHVEGTPLTIQERIAPLLALSTELTVHATRPTKQQPRSVAPQPLPLSDDALIARAIQARDGAKFRALFLDGETSGYSSPSEADLALCGILAFWTGRDASRMDSLFRRSALYREDKWDRNARRGETYGEGTIARATQLCTEVYTPAKPMGDVDTPRSTPVLAEAPATSAESNTPLLTDEAREKQLPDIILGGQLRDLVARARRAPCAWLSVISRRSLCSRPGWCR